MAAIDKTYIKSYSQYREIADWCKEQGTITDSFGNEITPYGYIPHIWEYDDNFNGTDCGEYTEEYINEWLNNIRKDNEKYKTNEYWNKCLSLYHDEDYNKKYSTLEKWCDYVDTWAEIPLWNTDHIFDIYLIKNCPVQFIQDRLKEQYGGGWSKEAFTSHSNSYEDIKNGTSVYDQYKRNGIKNPHFNIKYNYNIPFKEDNIQWWIEVVVNGEMWCYDDVSDYWFGNEECYMTKSNCWTSTSYGNYKGNMNFHRIRRILNKWNLPEGALVKFIGNYKRVHVKSFDVTVKK